MKDPYQVLGVSREATPEEIKKAYREKVKEYHPDLHPDDPNAAAMMNEINVAYGYIENPDRYEHDLALYRASRRDHENASLNDTNGSDSDIFDYAEGSYPPEFSRAYWWEDEPREDMEARDAVLQDPGLKQVPVSGSERIKTAIKLVLFLLTGFALLCKFVSCFS